MFPRGIFGFQSTRESLDHSTRLSRIWSGRAGSLNEVDFHSKLDRDKPRKNAAMFHPEKPTELLRPRRRKLSTRKTKPDFFNLKRFLSEGGIRVQCTERFAWIVGILTWKRDRRKGRLMNWIRVIRISSSPCSPFEAMAITRRRFSELSTDNQRGMEMLHGQSRTTLSPKYIDIYSYIHVYILEEVFSSSRDDRTAVGVASSRDSSHRRRF